jgi:hypothetical protein
MTLIRVSIIWGVTQGPGPITLGSDVCPGDLSDTPAGVECHGELQLRVEHLDHVPRPRPPFPPPAYRPRAGSITRVKKIDAH